MVRMRAGIAEGEETASARVKLRAALELHVDDEEERSWIEPRLAQLLGLEEQEAGDRQSLFGAWRLFFERIAERDPVVLVLEDVQWADAALLEFVEYLLDWARDHPIFVLVLARPEVGARHPHWPPGRNSTTLALEPLSHEAMEELLDGFAPGLPDTLRQQVLGRAEGVPLYAVETVRMLLDRGLLEARDGAYTTTRPIDALEVPETLQALVAARLDGLGPEERRLVQDAAVIGKTFTRSALAAVASSGEQDLDAPLAALVRKEIVSLRADPRSPERGQYAFLQDLVRQIAYDTLSRRDRKARHLAAAAQLEQEGLEAEHELAEIVAFHYLAALQLEPGADDADRLRDTSRATLLRAGERAAALGANEGAQRYFEQALDLVESTLDRADVHERAGRMATMGLRSSQARGHFEQAIAAFQQLGLDHAAARVTAELGILTWQQEGDLDAAVASLETSFALLVRDERDADLAQLAVQLGRLLYFRGRLDDAFDRTELALQIGEALVLPEVLSHGFNTKALILGSRGRPVEEEVLMRHALELALANGSSSAALRAYVNNGFVAMARNRYRSALEFSRAGTELARRVANREDQRNLMAWNVGLLVELGRWDEAVAEYEELKVINDRW
jgi:predicted ATPase